MTHQPAISFSNSIHFPFNRAGGRTSNVVQEFKVRRPESIADHTFQSRPFQLKKSTHHLNRPMKRYLLLFMLSSLALCRADDMSFSDIRDMFANAFMKMGPEPVGKLVYPSGTMDSEIKSIFAHKVTSIEVYPCSERDFKSSSGGKIDWPAMPIAKLYVQTDGPEDKDFSDAYFTIGSVDGKLVLMSKVDTTSPPAWRENMMTSMK